MLLTEYFTLDRWLSSSGFSDSFANLLLGASLLSLLGQLLILLSIKIEKVVNKHVIGILGLIALWFSFRYLAYPSVNNTDFHTWAFWSGVPFIIASILLYHEQYIILKDIFRKKKKSS
ncbi:hypothetical protein [Algibacter lectus]|nr:hypothetical protein [Algibacter lectus]